MNRQIANTPPCSPWVSLAHRPQTPQGLARSAPPQSPYMHCTSEIVRASEFGQCTSVFPTFQNGETETPGVIPGGFMPEV